MQAYLIMSGAEFARLWWMISRASYTLNLILYSPILLPSGSLQVLYLAAMVNAHQLTKSWLFTQIQEADTLIDTMQEVLAIAQSSHVANLISSVQQLHTQTARS